jgi:flavin reductase (DIM6/NTAB) family NADH-FMN oxidoreductase RutF
MVNNKSKNKSKAFKAAVIENKKKKDKKKLESMPIIAPIVKNPKEKRVHVPRPESRAAAEKRNNPPALQPLPKDEPFVKVDDNLTTRLLYPNPVCFLVTNDGTKRNVMSLSWLAPANNYGGFVFVIHKTRYSAAAIADKKQDFVLCVATSQHIDTLVAVGKVSGNKTDKLDGVSIPNLSMVTLGNYSSSTVGGAVSKKNIAKKNSYALLEDEDEEGGAASSSSIDGLLAVASTVAHMRCSVISVGDAADEG